LRFWLFWKECVLTPDPLSWISIRNRAVKHIPALRGEPERGYKATRAREEGGLLRVTGPFPPYVASLLADWQEKGETARLEMVRQNMVELGLAGTIQANQVSASEVELRVARTLAQPKSESDFVDIADVGVGVSQVLPLIVALAGARDGQLVYVEQPELHLHPRAQWIVGKILARAARGGIRLVVETHSLLVLRAVQHQLASGSLKPEEVGLYWFSRDTASGFSNVVRAELDDKGRFGEWPVDFSEVEFQADEEWLAAALGQKNS